MHARLKAARLNRGLSIKAAAEQIGVSGPTLARAEAGQPPQAAKAYRIASFFGLTVTDLWPLEADEGAPVQTEERSAMSRHRESVATSGEDGA